MMKSPAFKVPQGWRIQKLSELIVDGDIINYGVVQPGTDYPNGVRIVRVADLINGGIRVDKLKQISPEIESSYSRSRLVGDEILIACVGSIGSISLATTALAGCNIARAVARIRCNESVDRNYLAKYLATDAVQNYFIKETRTVAQPTLNIGQIKETKVLLPPLSEQKRIAGILDQVDGLRRKRQQTLALTDQFLRSTFLDLFGDPVANPKRWPEARLDEIADIQSGVTKGRKLNGQQTVFVPYMRVANVQDGHLVLDEIKEIEVPANEVQKFQLQAGDVLLTEGGDFDKLGRGTVWRGEINPCIHQNHIFRVRPKDGKVLSEFLSAILASSRGKRYFLSAAKQTTGIASINKTQLSGFPAFLPPVDLQAKYETLVCGNHRVADRLTTRFGIVDKLFNSLVQQAFQGKL